MKPSFNIVLYGMMGVGKSAVAAIISARTGLPAVDTDAVFEARFGPVSDYFAACGEPSFRAKEKAIVVEAARCVPSVISVGGGAVLDPDNMRALKATGKAVLLTASPETIYRRVSGSDSRPLLKGGSMTDIVKILNQRRVLYERYADCVIATDALTPEACAEAVLGAVGLGANLGDDRGTDAAPT